MTPDLVQQLQRMIELRNAGRSDDAIAHGLGALRAYPGQQHLMMLLGMVHLDRAEFEVAVAWLGKAVEAAPTEERIWSQYGFSLKSVGRLDEGLAAYDRALRLDPKFGQARLNRAVLLAEMHRIEEALTEFDFILRHEPNWAEAHFSRALALLLRGDFERGWDEFVWLWKADAFPFSRRKFDRPLWDGVSTEGKTVLLYGGQGYGDTLQFIRYAKPLAELGARVVVEIEPELAELAATVSGVTQLVIAGDALPAFDFHAPMMAMPQLMRTTLDTIPAGVPYVQPDPSRVAAWRARLRSDDSPILGPNVGLVWAGNPRHTRDRQRSLGFTELRELLTAAPVRWRSLQVGRNEALASDDSGVEVDDLSPDLIDYSDTAAAVSAMDLVITVDTSVAHVAGALGKPTWVFLPFCPDFRWMLDRSDSPWYPSMRLYRERAYGARAEVIARMAEALVKYPNR